VPISEAHCTGEQFPLPLRETGRVPISGAHCTGERSPLPLRERVRVRGHSSDWHGSAMQDTRTPSSTGFRRRYAAGRVTFLCVAKEKSPKERPPPLVRPPASGRPASRPGQTASPRRTTGGVTPSPQPRGKYQIQDSCRSEIEV